MNQLSKQPGKTLSAAAQRGKQVGLAVLITRVILLVIIVSGLITGAMLLPVKAWLVSLLEWTQGLGIWGPVFVAAFYVVACVLFLPGSVLTLGTGFIFKLLVGTITVSIGSTLGACAAFLVGRTIGRNWIAARVTANPKFTAIDDAVGRQGFKTFCIPAL